MRVIAGLIALIMCVSVLNAAVYKGQRAYKDRCKLCHDTGNKLATKYTKKEWEEFFAYEGERLAVLHTQNKKVAQKLQQLHQKGEAKTLRPKHIDAFFDESNTNRKSFSRLQRHLKDFFTVYAKDSNAVPACN